MVTKEQIIEYLNGTDFCRVYKVPATTRTYAVSVEDDFDIDDPDDAELDEYDEIDPEPRYENETYDFYYELDSEQFNTLKEVIQYVKDNIHRETSGN